MIYVLFAVASFGLVGFLVALIKISKGILIKNLELVQEGAVLIMPALILIIAGMAGIHAS